MSGRARRLGRAILVAMIGIGAPFVAPGWQTRLEAAVPACANAAPTAHPVGPVVHPARCVVRTRSGWVSSNWSGYTLTGSGFRAVSGSWTVPAVAVSGIDTYSSTWVGIDGWSNQDLIQTGTEQDSIGGRTQYYAWWEILPAPETYIPEIAVSPGDTMTASIAQTGAATWRISLHDRTNGDGFVTTVQYAGPLTSAEWIQEAPTVGGQIATLADYGRTAFVNASVNTFAPSLSASQAGVMLQGSQQVSTPSVPDAEATGFSVAYGAAAPPPPSQPANGAFVRTPDGAIYVIAGGAPVYVSTCAPLAGCPGLVAAGDLSQFRSRPANGTFIAGAQRGEVYRIAGGAPLYVSTWSAFGGAKPLVTVDQVAIDNAGRGGVFDHLRDRPSDGTFISGAQRGEVYRIAGGAPVYVSAWSVFGGPKPTTTVDQLAIDDASNGATAWSHLRYFPGSGRFLTAAGTGTIFRMAGNAALPIYSCARLAGCPSRASVDPAALANAGRPGAFSHLLTQPANGTILEVAGSGACWRIVNGRRYRSRRTAAAVRVNLRTVRAFPIG